MFWLWLPVTRLYYTLIQRWAFVKENKKVKKQELDQEKMKVFFFFSWSLSWSSSCFLVSYFLVFFYKFPPQSTATATAALWLLQQICVMLAKQYKCTLASIVAGHSLWRPIAAKEGMQNTDYSRDEIHNFCEIYIYLDIGGF